MSQIGSSPANSAGSVRSRSSVPLLYPQSSKGSPTILPDLHSTGRNSSCDKLNNVQDILILTSRAVAQSMLSVSSSCPDLTRKRPSPLARYESEKYNMNVAARSTSAGGMSSTGKLVRYRVPLSIASNLSEGTPRMITHKKRVFKKRDVEHSPSPTENKNAGYDSDNTLSLRLSSAQLPMPNEGQMASSSSSPHTARAIPRRRAGQYSLTARNEIQGSGWPKRAPSDSARSVVGAAGVVQNYPPLVTNTQDKGVPNNGLRREQSSNSLTASIRHARDSQTPRIQGGTQARRISGQRISVSTNPELNTVNKQVVEDNDKVAVKDNQSDEATESDGKGEDNAVPDGMSPDTYDMCVKWVIGVESAKSERTLDTIVFPSMHRNSEHR